MNREVHVRFWESPEVKVLRATRQLRRIEAVSGVSGCDPIAPELSHRSNTGLGKPPRYGPFPFGPQAR
jgi:hypothetical protein